MSYGIKDLAKDALKGDIQISSDELAKTRYAICQTCPFLKESKKCAKCGCFMPIKTKLIRASCPIKKW
jgi:hypothetical protein